MAAERTVRVPTMLAVVGPSAVVLPLRGGRRAEHFGSAALFTLQEAPGRCWCYFMYCYR